MLESVIVRTASRRVAVLAATAIVLALLSALGSVSLAHASGNGAGVYRGFVCYLGDASNNLVTTTDTHSVDRANGTNLLCQATVPNPTGETIVRDGFPCSAGGVITTDTHETISASGNATLTCHSHF
jgi:hypothetical protein